MDKMCTDIIDTDISNADGFIICNIIDRIHNNIFVIIDTTDTDIFNK